jgi:hypothetical protein
MGAKVVASNCKVYYLSESLSKKSHILVCKQVLPLGVLTEYQTMFLGQYVMNDEDGEKVTYSLTHED